MSRPGDRIRAMAARVCRAEIMERLIDPLVADLQTEYTEAVRQGRVWRSRSVRIAGYVAFLKVLVFCGWEGAVRTLDCRLAGENRTARRMIGWTVAATVTVTALLAVWPLLRLPGIGRHLDALDRTKLLLYLIPQALVVAVPIGITIGILGGSADRPSSRRLTGGILAIAFVCSLAAFGAIAWVVPVSNQAFRVTSAGRNIAKGFAELTLGEMGQQIRRAETHRGLNGEPSPRQLEIAYYSRSAFSCATFVLAVFSLAIVRRRWAGRTIVGVSVCALYFAYYLGPTDVTELSRDGSLPAFVISWLPNGVLGVLSVALATVHVKADTSYDSGSA